MNFVIFRDFLIIFLILYEFIWIYFELNILKNYILSCADVAANMARAKRALTHGACVCVSVCACMVSVCIIRDKTLFLEFRLSH